MGWSMRSGDHFIFCRVKSFQEVTLDSGETIHVPTAIACAFTDQDVVPSFELQAGESAGQSQEWKTRKLAADADLQYNRARYFDPTPGRFIEEG